VTPTDLRDHPVSRRCALFGVGGIGAAAVLAACSSGSDGGSGTATTPASTPADTSSAPTSAAPTTGSSSADSSPAGDAIASLSDIPVGGSASAQVNGETVLLSQPTAGTVEAFSSSCPHQGGVVKPDGAKFKCSLHGSEFTLDGAVTQGPATSDLTSVPVTVSGDSVVAG
jgi:Rieske Fe-S protein